MKHHRENRGGWWLWSISIIGTGVLLLTAAFPAAAARFTVNSPQDITDAAPGDGSCNVKFVGAPVCTLRAAVEEANTTLISDTIVFKKDLGPIVVENGEIRIAASTVIQGYSNSSLQVIRGHVNNRHGIFKVTRGIVRFQYLILEQGKQYVEEDGGCLDIDSGAAVVEIKKVLFTECEASGDGGAIDNDADLLYVIGGEFNNNVAANRGGAIFTDGEAGGEPPRTLVSKSRFLGNFSQNNGGAMASDGDYGDQYVRDSIFLGNLADEEGGAIHHSTRNGTTLVLTSKFRNNMADEGGAICHDLNEGILFALDNIDAGGNFGTDDLFGGTPLFFCRPD